ncbi:hypothetical protein ABZ749_23725, partial [Micromonospora sp. NPDC047753]
GPAPLPRTGWRRSRSGRDLTCHGPPTRRAVVAWSYLSPPDVNPGADGIFDALDQLAADRKVMAR